MKITHQNLVLEWTRRVNFAKSIALGVRTRGVSHRNLQVGGAALVYDPKDESIGFFEGANFKPQPGKDGPRKCAEEEMIEHAEKQGLQIIGMVIAAPPQPDDETGRDLGVTVCCGSCRRLIRSKLRPSNHKKPCISLETELLFVNANEPSIMVPMDVKQLLEIFPK